jgi:glutamate-1-semialdehyde 2,1-aminomutase
MAAGIVGCSILNLATIERLNALGDTLRGRIAATIEMYLCSDQAGTAVSARKMYVTGIGSLLNITFTGQGRNTLQAIFYHYMLERGLYIATRGYVALNIEITDEHVEAFVKAIQGFLVEYRDALL